MHRRRQQTCGLNGQHTEARWDTEGRGRQGAVRTSLKLAPALGVKAVASERDSLRSGAACLRHGICCADPRLRREALLCSGGALLRRQAAVDSNTLTLPWWVLCYSAATLRP